MTSTPDESADYKALTDAEQRLYARAKLKGMQHDDAMRIAKLAPGTAEPPLNTLYASVEPERLATLYQDQRQVLEDITASGYASNLAILKQAGRVIGIADNYIPYLEAQVAELRNKVQD